MRTLRVPITWLDVPMACQAEFDPGESAIYWPTERAHPGEAPSATLTGCHVGGVNILPLLSNQQVGHIEQHILDRMEFA